VPAPPLTLLQRLRRLLPTPETVRGNRWLRWLGPAVLHPRLWHMSRRGVAAGAAIGMFFAFLTPIAQIPLSAAVSVALRANVPAAIVATLANTPLTFGPVYYGAWRVGSWLLGEDTAKEPAALKQVSEISAGGPMAAASAAADVAVALVEDITPGSESAGWMARAWAQLQDIGKPLLLGTLLFSVSFAALSWLLVNAVWHLRVRLKRRRRLRQRAA